MLEVVEASGLATIQDLGRRGWRRFGVPLSGPMDAFAFQAANLLARQFNDAAAIGNLAEAKLNCRRIRIASLQRRGQDISLSVYTWEFPLWDLCFVHAGWKIRFKKKAFWNVGLSRSGWQF